MSILTVPEAISDTRGYTVTANEFVALPELGLADAACYSLNVLLDTARGLVEFRGGGHAHGRGDDDVASTPLLRPWFEVAGSDAADPWRVSFEADWLPVFTTKVGDVEVHVRYLAPPAEKGLVLVCRAENRGVRGVSVKMAWEFTPALLAVTVFSRRPWGGTQQLRWDKWTKAMVWEGLAGSPQVAMALRPPANADWRSPVVQPGVPILTECEVFLEAGEQAQREWMVGVNLDGDGAALNAVHLARQGWNALHQNTVAALEKLQLRPGNLPTPLVTLTSRNLLFNLYFSNGRTLDSEELVLITSRSPRYYVSGAHWTRDSLLWSLPGILELDPGLARGLLVSAFARYTKHPGEHAQYLDGHILYPGFELDQLAAFWMALARYLHRTNDRSVLAEPSVKASLSRLDETVANVWDRKTGLCRTFLLPSDDPAPYPFVIYDNALLWVAWKERMTWSREPSCLPHDFLDTLRAAIYRHGVVTGPYGAQWAWAVDGSGQSVLYDEPPGSLELLAYYGFCSFDDPVYRNTVKWIFSPHNPSHLPESQFGTVGCPHAPYPWVLTWINGLLCGRGAEVTPHLMAATMDSGLACETVHPQHGRAQTGAAFATCAGFLGYGLLYWGRRWNDWRS